MVYWPRDGGIVIRIKFKKGFEVYSLSSVTFVFYRELNSRSFILVQWVGGLVGGWGICSPRTILRHISLTDADLHLLKIDCHFVNAL